MKLFRKFLKKYKWYLFIGLPKEGETKTVINFKEEGWLERGQYFEAIFIDNKTYKIGLSGNSGWNRGDIVSIDKDDLLKEYSSEKEAMKYSETSFDGWDDPEGESFGDGNYDRLADMGIVHK